MREAEHMRCLQVLAWGSWLVKIIAQVRGTLCFGQNVASCSSSNEICARSCQSVFHVSRRVVSYRSSSSIVQAASSFPSLIQSSPIMRARSPSPHSPTSPQRRSISAQGTRPAAVVFCNMPPPCPESRNCASCTTPARHHSPPKRAPSHT